MAMVPWWVKSDAVDGAKEKNRVVSYAKKGAKGFSPVPAGFEPARVAPKDIFDCYTRSVALGVRSELNSNPSP